MTGGHRLTAMPDFTIKNLKELDDVAAERGRAMSRRASAATISTPSTSASVTSATDPASARRIGHRHREQEEAYVVVSGSGRIRLDDEVVELRQWDVVRVAPAVVRAFEGGPDGIEVIAIGSDRPEGGDGEMVQDFWAAD